MDMPTYMLMRFRIRNFFEWKKSYDGYLMKRIEAGLIEKFLFRGADDTNEVTLLFQLKDLARARAFVQSPEVRARMIAGGVVAGPDVFFLSSYSEAVAKASGF